MSSRTRPAVDQVRPSRAGHGDGVVVKRSRRLGGHVVEMQRRRLLTATLELVYEQGVQAVTVALVSDRAGVSRKTFYDIFEDRERCLLGAFEEAVGRATEVVEHAVVGEERWRVRVRAGLTGLLSFLDDEPIMGRLLIVEALSAGAATLNVRGRVLAQIVAVVEGGRMESEAGRYIPPLTAEGVVGAVFSVIHARMLDCVPSANGSPGGGRRDTPLFGELVGSLMAVIVQPYLGPGASKKELELPAPPAKRPTPKLPADPFKDLPIRLTYRTARVLASIAAAPGASSKQIAVASDVADEGQMSRLLTRLERAALIHNTGNGPVKGEPNAWSLTPKGERVQVVITQQTRAASTTPATAPGSRA